MDDDDEPAAGPGDGPLWALDFVVPDDISELEPDITAYRREQRTLRRRRVAARWGIAAPARRHLVAPLAALCLLVAAIAGSVLVSLDPRSAPPVTARAPLARTGYPQGSVGGLLPDVVLTGQGARVHLRELRPAVVALIPARCGCTNVLDHLAAQADEAGVDLVIVAPPGGGGELDALLSGMHVGAPSAGVDAAGTLARYYRPSGVTAVLVAPDGQVPYRPVRGVSATTDLQGELFQMVPAGG